jgi:hypothetical protein
MYLSDQDPVKTGFEEPILLNVPPNEKRKSRKDFWTPFRFPKKNEFMRLEVWRNAQALEEHKATAHIKASFDNVRSKAGRPK